MTDIHSTGGVKSQTHEAVKSPITSTPFTIKRKSKAENSRVKPGLINVTAGNKPHAKGTSLNGMEETLTSLKGKYEKMLADNENALEGLSQDKAFHFLKSENLQLRTELKRLNDFLTYLVELRKYSISKKPKEKAAFSMVRSKEDLQNKLTEVEAEYNKDVKRIEMVSDPAYSTDLKQRILSLDLKIKKWEKHKKSMELSQKKNEHLINKAETEEPEISQELSTFKKSLAATNGKLQGIDSTLDKHAKTLADLGEKIAEMKDKSQKLSNEAVALGINVGGAKSPASKKYEELTARKEPLAKTVNLLKTRYTMTLGEYNQKTGKLQQKVNEISELLKQKYDVMAKKNEELEGLIIQLSGTNTHKLTPPQPDSESPQEEIEEVIVP